MGTRFAALNLLWLASGGWIAYVLWLAASRASGVLLGRPFRAASSNIACFASRPFGRDLGGEGTFGRPTRAESAAWLAFIGVWLALAHLLIALPLFATVVGMPFGMAHLRLAATALDPLDRCELRATA